MHNCSCNEATGDYIGVYHNHVHNHCVHDVAYCAVCDVCYCKKCHREWRAQNIWWNTTYPNNIIWTYSSTGTAYDPNLGKCIVG